MMLKHCMSGLFLFSLKGSDLYYLSMNCVCLLLVSVDEFCFFHLKCIVATSSINLCIVLLWTLDFITNLLQW